MRHLLFLAILCARLLCPRAALAQPRSLAYYWPHVDGRERLYDQHHEDLYPPGPTVDNQARLYFDGATVAPVGITAQVLSGEVTSPPALPNGNLEAPAEIGDPFLQAYGSRDPICTPGFSRPPSS